MLRTITLLTLLLLTFNTTAHAQTGRMQTRGADGRLAWKPHKVEDCNACTGKKKIACRNCNGGRKKLEAKCLECKGKKKAPCRKCGGIGKTYDPFVLYPCMRCEARGFCPCTICSGTLKLRVSGKGTPPKCRSCSKKGGAPCLVCGGDRLMRFLTANSKMLEAASADELRALRKKLRGPMDRLTAYTKEGSTYPARAFPTLMKDVVAVLPEFKKDLRACEKSQKLCAKKQKNLKANLSNALGHIRARTAIAALNALRHHMSVTETLLNVHKANSLKK
jgi:hypothetical protein